MGVGRTARYHEGVGAAYDSARRQLLGKMDDEAYQSFVQSFRFCHECRQFVCNECWSTSRRSCLTCVAKSMTGVVRPRPPFAPTGPDIPRPVVATAQPHRGRLRRDATLVALAIAIVMLALEGGVLLAAATSPNPGVADAPATSAPATATATPTPAPTATPTATPTASPSPTASPTATPSPSPTPTPTPTPTPPPVVVQPTAPPPTPTPVPTLPVPLISCSPTNEAVAPYTITCFWLNVSSFPSGSVGVWSYGGSGAGSNPWEVPDNSIQAIQLIVWHGSVESPPSETIYFNP